MPKNVVAGILTGIVIAAAVAGLGWLFLRGGPAKRGPIDPGPAKADARRTVPKPPEGTKTAAPPKGATAAAPTKPAPVAAGDVCKRVDDIFREYDLLVQADLAGAAAGGPVEVDRISTLRERKHKIDRMVDRLVAFGPDAVPCLVDQLRQSAAGGADRIARQTIAVEALSRIPGPEALNALAEALATAEAWGIKMTIVAQLADQGGEAGLKLLADRLVREEDFRVRGAILKFLGQKKSAEGLLVAQRLAAGDQNPNVRIAAIRALGDAGDDSAARVLEDRARIDPDIAVRQNAIQVYGRILKDQSLALHEDLLVNDPNLRIKAVAILALQELGSEGARRVLERTAADPAASEDVRARATGALAAMDRQAQGAGMPSIGSKLEGFDPKAFDKLRPIPPANVPGGSR